MFSLLCCLNNLCFFAICVWQPENLKGKLYFLQREEANIALSKDEIQAAVNESNLEADVEYQSKY